MDVEKALKRDPYVLYNEDTDETSLRKQFFKNAQFRILPLKEEIEQNILIPGHRLIPFYAVNVLPWNVTIKLSDDNQLSTKQIEKKAQDLFIYNSLFGFQQMLYYFITDNKENEKHINSDFALENVKLKITVFDMKKIYQKYNFKEDDYFLITVKDWEKGIYEMEYCHADKN